MRIREPEQRHEVWCTEWVGHIQSMYDNVSDTTFILSMRCLLKKYGSESKLQSGVRAQVAFWGFLLFGPWE